jgi:hypothetical protein
MIAVLPSCLFVIASSPLFARAIVDDSSLLTVTAQPFLIHVLTSIEVQAGFWSVCKVRPEAMLNLLCACSDIQTAIVAQCVRLRVAPVRALRLSALPM